MKKIVILLLLIIGLGFAGYKSQDYWRGKAYEIVTPIRGPAVQAVYATGTVEASVTIPVAPRQTARLMALHADEGQTVEKGMVIAQLEDADLQNALNDRKASAALAQKEFDRQQALSRSGATSKQALDRAQAALESAQAMVAQAEANLSFMRLIAPEDGTIIRREGEIGEMIPINQPVFWMSCCAGLRIAAEVDEEDISLVKTGQKVLIRADAFPGKIFNGTVQSITPKGDPIARSYRVRVSLAEADNPLMIGMTAETNIIIAERQNALLIPTSALIRDGVYTVKDGHTKFHPVEIGAKTDGLIEIIKGLEGDEDVILNPGVAEIKDGTRVRTTRPNQTVTP